MNIGRNVTRVYFVVLFNKKKERKDTLISYTPLISIPSFRAELHSGRKLIPDSPLTQIAFLSKMF